MANKKRNLNEGIFEGKVKGLKAVDRPEGKALVFLLEHKHAYIDQNGEQKESIENLKCCVHPSQVEYLGKKIAEGQNIEVIYQLQVRPAVQQPDGSWLLSSCAMVTDVVNHVNRLHVIGFLARDAKLSQNGNSVFLTVSSNDRFGDGTSFIPCRSFAKNIINLASAGYLAKGTGVCVTGKATTDEKGEVNFVISQLNFVNNKPKGTVGAGTVAVTTEAVPQQQEQVLDISDDQMPF